ncbi:MAG: Na+/H+ antiporter subunit E [Natronospirillum sp.]
MATEIDPVSGWPKWIPHPLMSVVVFLSWLVLSSSVSFGNIVLGAFLGVILPRVTRRFWRHPVTIRSWPKLIRFAVLVIWDIVVSNLQAVLLLLKSPQDLKPAFFVIHLDITDPIAITVLANTITLTPGTVSADISSRQERLLIHGLHVPDVEAAIKTIKERYEAPLKEIF